MKLYLFSSAIIVFAKAATRDPTFPPCVMEVPGDPDPPIYNYGGICCKLNEFNFLDTECRSSCPSGTHAQAHVCVPTCTNNHVLNGVTGNCECPATGNS